MSEKMKGRCLILVALLMVMPYAPAVLAAEIEVDKGEFNAKWQETYNELKAIDPAAAEEFRTLTVEEFKTGRVGYAPDAEGQTAQTTPTASVSAQGIRGPRETANAPAPTAGTGLNSMPRGQYGGPVPGNAPGAGPGPYPGGPVAGEFRGPLIGGQMYGPGPLGPGPQGPYVEGSGPYYGPAPLSNEHMGPGPFGPMPEGQMFQGPVGPQGPMFEGPFVGPAPEGPMFEGPIGPPPDGPYFEGLMFEPPPVVEPPPFEPPPGPEPPPPPPPPPPE